MAETLLVVALGLIVAVAVAYPLVVGRTRFGTVAELDAAVLRYRRALAAGTICGHCRFANPEGSRFCAECGRRLDRGS